MSNKTVRFIHQGDLKAALWEMTNVIEHDVSCWKDALRHAENSGNIILVAIASARIESLKQEALEIQEAIEQ